MKRAAAILLAWAAFAGAGEAAGPANPLDGLRLEDLSATRERPLFAPTRRPPPAPSVEAPPPPPVVEVKAVAVVAEPPPFDLVGSVVGAESAFVLLRNKTSSLVVRLRAGEEAEGWRVGEIGLRSVALEREGRHESLALAAPQPTSAAPEIAGDPAQVDPSAEPPAPPMVAGKPRFVGMQPQRQ